MQETRRWFEFKFIESYENGKKPIFIKDGAKVKKVPYEKAKIAAKRAKKKMPFPMIDLRNSKFIATCDLFKPIIGHQPVTNENKIEWFESIEYTKAQAEGLAEKFNEQIRKAKEVKLITGKKETQLLLPMY